MPPQTSPARRVLSEKDANASLNITSPNKALKASFNARPGLAAQVQSKVISGIFDVASSPPRTGQKRRIIEVEDVEARDWNEEVKASQTTDIVSDSASETDHMETSMMSTRSAADTTMTSIGFAASQENLVEQQFELPEPEMSQRTLDKIHAVALPQNTSQPSQLQERPQLVQNTSQDSVGMSSFLNFHSDASSQGSDMLKMVDSALLPNETRADRGTSAPQVEKELSEEQKRKTMMEEKAAQLRSRLQLAFFKVVTRQTSTPLSRLKVPESFRRKSESPPSLPQPPVSFHRPQSHSVSATLNDRTGLSPEARIAALRAQATMQHKPAVRSLDTLPMPQIKPTAFSARWAEETLPSNEHSHPALRTRSLRVDGSEGESFKIPSSPPVSTLSLHIHEDETATAARSRTNSADEGENSPVLPTPKTPANRSTPQEQSLSPPLSQGDEARDVLGSDIETSQTLQTQPRERRLTSSVVKGEAASGLLQLMRSGAVDTRNMRGPMCGL